MVEIFHQILTKYHARGVAKMAFFTVLNYTFNGRIMLKVSLEDAFLHLSVRKDVKWTFP